MAEIMGKGGPVDKQITQILENAKEIAKSNVDEYPLGSRARYASVVTSPATREETLWDAYKGGRPYPYKRTGNLQRSIRIEKRIIPPSATYKRKQIVGRLVVGGRNKYDAEYALYVVQGHTMKAGTIASLSYGYAGGGKTSRQIGTIKTSTRVEGRDFLTPALELAVKSNFKVRRSATRN